MKDCDGNLLDLDQMRSLVRERSVPFGGIKPMCDKMGVAYTPVLLALHGERVLSRDFAMYLGYERIVMYRRVGDAPEV